VAIVDVFAAATGYVVASPDFRSDRLIKYALGFENDQRLAAYVRAHTSPRDSVYALESRADGSRPRARGTDSGIDADWRFALLELKTYAPDAATRKDGIDYGSKWIDIARVIGSPSVRQHVSGAKGAKPDVALAAESLGQLAEYGSKRNIIVNLENDNPIAEDPFFLVSLIQKVNSPYLRALPDFGNSLIGHDPEYNDRAVRAMFKYAYSMCHVKDTVQGKAGERATVDLKKMFGIARESSYRGYFSMEFDTDAGDPFQGTQTLVQETLQYM